MVTEIFKVYVSHGSSVLSPILAATHFTNKGTSFSLNDLKYVEIQPHFKQTNVTVYPILTKGRLYINRGIAVHTRESTITINNCHYVIAVYRLTAI